MVSDILNSGLIKLDKKTKFPSPRSTYIRVRSFSTFSYFEALVKISGKVICCFCVHNVVLSSHFQIYFLPYKQQLLYIKQSLWNEQLLKFQEIVTMSSDYVTNECFNVQFFHHLESIFYEISNFQCMIVELTKV